MSELFAKPFKLAEVATALLADFTSDSEAVIAAIEGIEQTELKTDLMSVFETVIPELLTRTADRRILLIISDGEHTIDSDRQQILDASLTFKQAGGIIIVLGVRASGAGYDLLERIASSGYFINATPDNAESAINGLNYLKSLLCAGGCAVTGDEYVATPQRDYHEFLNFEVSQGKVNLLGPGLLDLLPGNGLYVEMSEGEAGGSIRTSAPISLVAGRTYRVSFTAAGNQRSSAPGQGIKVFIREIGADDEDPNIFEQSVFPDYDDDFQTFAFSFTPSANASVRINFQQVGTDSLLLHGSLLGSVKFDDATTLVTILEDNFDDENVVFIAPSCGASNAFPEVPNADAPVVERIFTGSTALGGGDSLRNLVPAMTSNTSPSGVASDSNGSSDAWRVFDGTANGWTSGIYFAPNLPAWLQYDFGASKEVVSYAVTGCGAASTPNNFVFEGSNDGSSWDVLDIQFATLSPETRTEFTLGSPETYRYFRLRITSATDISSYACVREFEIIGMAPADGEQVCRLGVSYVTNTGETAVVNTVDYTAEYAEDIFRITVPISASDRVTAVRLWRSLGADPVESEMYLLAEIPANQSAYLDSERRAAFEARYDDSVLAPTDNDTEIAEGGLGVGYDCYLYECTSEPPGVQSPDGSPLPDIESGYTPPQQYTSTKTACAECPEGEENNSNENLIPAMTSATEPSGQVIYSAQASPRNAWNAFDGSADTWWVPQAGATTGWIGYKFDSAKVVRRYSITAITPAVGLPKNFTFEGSNDGSSWTVLDTRTNQSWYSGEKKNFSITNASAYLYYRINVTSSTGNTTQNLNIAEIEMFGGVSTRVCRTASRTSYVSQSDADTLAANAARAEAEAALNCIQSFTATESYTATCPDNTYGQSVTKSATRTSHTSQDDAQAQALAAAKAEAKAELNCEGSNNSTKITIHDSTKADPYPSVKFISGLSGVVTKVTVTLKRFNHGDYGDCNVLLVSPEGTKIVLMSGAMNGAFDTTERNITFDDDAASLIPQSTRPAGVDHTFKPAAYEVASFPAPAPSNSSEPFYDGAAPYYASGLSAFNGENPNGAWSLWIYDDLSLNNGYCLNGWDLNITTA